MKQFVDSVPGAVWIAAYGLLYAVLQWQFDETTTITVVGIVAILLKAIGVSLPDEPQPQATMSRSIGSPTVEKRSKIRRFLLG